MTIEEWVEFGKKLLEEDKAKQEEHHKKLVELVKQLAKNDDFFDYLSDETLKKLINEYNGN